MLINYNHMTKHTPETYQRIAEFWTIVFTALLWGVNLTQLGKLLTDV